MSLKTLEKNCYSWYILGTERKKINLIVKAMCFNGSRVIKKTTIHS